MKVLVAVDGSDESRHAMMKAFELFGQDPDYVLVSVGAPTVPLTLGYPAGGFTSPGELEAAARAAESAAHEAVQQAEVELAAAHVDTVVASEPGSIGGSLVHVADEIEADVIVIGSHDRGVFERLFDPSVGKYLINHANCPVLVVR